MADLEITTHVQCHARDLQSVLARYQQVLDRVVGTRRSQLSEWLNRITWDPDDGGFVQVGSPLPFDGLSIDRRVIEAEPYVVGYADASVPGDELPWVQLSLVIGNEQAALLVDEASGRYKPGVGKVVWSATQEFAQVFCESAVFFNDGPSVNEPWKALIEANGDLWAFELALIPYNLAARFQVMPADMMRIALPDRIGYALDSCWRLPPWHEGTVDLL